MPDVALATVMDYVELDKKVNRTVSVLLRDYLADSDDDLTKRMVAGKWQANYPEIAILKRAGEFRHSGEYVEAIRLYERALQMNPIYSDAYNGLGACHIQLGNYDSALVLLQIGVGLNPNGSGLWYNLGSAYSGQGDFARAEKAWLRAERLDPNNVLPLTHLALLYKQQNRMDEYFQYLVRVAHRDDTPVAFLQDLGDLYVLKGDFRQAATAYERSLAKGLDSAYVEKVVNTYPQLKGALGW
jgi:tetratricopeptide (TPR) repeat protein